MARRVAFGNIQDHKHYRNLYRNQYRNQYRNHRIRLSCDGAAPGEGRALRQQYIAQKNAIIQ